MVQERGEDGMNPVVYLVATGMMLIAQDYGRSV